MENSKACKIRDIFFRKMKIFDIIDDLIQSGSNCIAVIAWIFAVKCVEDHGLRRLTFVIALHHCKLIQVCQ